MDRFIKFARLERDDKKITVQIREVIWGTYVDFEGREVKFERGEGYRFYLSKTFKIISSCGPELRYNELYVHGSSSEEDQLIVFKIFDNIEDAQEVYDLLQRISLDYKFEIYDNNEKLNKIIGGLVNDVVCVVDQK